MNYSQNTGLSTLTIKLTIRNDTMDKLEEYCNNKGLKLDTGVSYLITEAFRE